MEPGNPALDGFVLELGAARRPDPRICLLPTAGGDSELQIQRFMATFGDLPCEPTSVSLFRLGRRPLPLREHLLAQDVIYVGGGSLLNMLAVWRAHGLDTIMSEAWHAGIVLAGLSAGSMCWFQGGITCSSGAPMPAAGLGLLPGSNSVHYDGEPHRRPRYLEAVRRGELDDGYGVDDGAALLFAGTQLIEVVASRPSAGAVCVQRHGDGPPAERPLPVRVLAVPPGRDGAAAAPFAVSELRQMRSRPPAGTRRSARRAGLHD